MHLYRETIRHLRFPLNTCCLGQQTSTASSSLFSTYSALNKSPKHVEPRVLSQTPMAIRLRARWANDPVWREKMTERMSRNTRLRYNADPNFRAKELARGVAQRTEMSRKDPYYTIFRNLRSWLYHPSMRHRFRWQSHFPAWTHEILANRCASCHIKKREGQTLWFQRRVAASDTKEFECWACFTSNPEIALPEGFKDVRSNEQLLERKNQLFGKCPSSRSLAKLSTSSDLSSPERQSGK